MKPSNPKEQKRLGRQVKNFEPIIWDRCKYSIVYLGNMAKFTQNEELKRILLATGEKTLVEASPLDQIWGIGLAEDSPLAQDRKTWRGENLLGKALTAVKDHIRAEMYPHAIDFMHGELVKQQPDFKVK